MSKINILDSEIFNRISAGEVVESPYSVVKELIENSIDAESDTVTLEIKGGGIDFIRVIDNGKGMSSDDVPKAFLPHATSKIKTLDDLNAISTLGFRGEAIPSIASVSNITILSKQKDDELGYFLTMENGELLAQSEVGSSDGTTVTVKDLFANIPARRKFLKKPSSEAAKIKELVKNLILANPNIAIKFISDDKIIFHSDGKGVESAIFTVYGDIIDDMMPIKNSMSGVEISGFASEPSFSKHNKSNQTIIVNNRVVESEEIAFSIYLCYREFLMTRQYPIYIIYINIPNDLIDVNVHPNKLSVKFVDVNIVKKLIYNTISKSITHKVIKTDMFNSSKNNAFNQSQVIFNEAASTKDNNTAFNEIHTTHSCDTLTFNQVHSDMNEPFVKHDVEFNQNECEIGRVEEKCFEQNIKNDIFTPNIKENEFNPNHNDSDIKSYDIYPFFRNTDNYVVRESDPITTTNNIYQNSQPATNSNENCFDNSSFLDIVKDDDSLKYVGKLFNTYIIVERFDTIYMIDQHAAHERILYDELIEKFNSSNIQSQTLMLPYEFEVSDQDTEILNSSIDHINTLGFNIQKMGENMYIINAIPLCCINLKLNEFVSTLLNDPHKNLERSDFIKDKIAQSACKAAIKGKDDLTKYEISLLLNKMKESGGALLCPHGRPTVVQYSKTEIEKMFKRIV